MQTVRIGRISLDDCSIPADSKVTVSFLSSPARELLLSRQGIARQSNQQVEILALPLQASFSSEESQLLLKVEGEQSPSPLEVLLDLSHLQASKRVVLKSEQPRATVIVEVWGSEEREMPGLRRGRESGLGGIPLQQFLRERKSFIAKFRNKSDKEEAVNQKIYRLLKETRSLKRKFFGESWGEREFTSGRLNVHNLRVVSGKKDQSQQV